LLVKFPANLPHLSSLSFAFAFAFKQTPLLCALAFAFALSLAMQFRPEHQLASESTNKMF
jgi:uncharacterized membrane protein